MTSETFSFPLAEDELEDISYSQLQRIGSELDLGKDVIGKTREQLEEMIADELFRNGNPEKIQETYSGLIDRQLESLQEKGEIQKQPTKTQTQTKQTQQTQQTQQTSQMYDIGEEIIEQIGENKDVLVVMEDTESSEAAATALQEPIMQDDIAVVTLSSDIGEELARPLDSDTKTPFYIETKETQILKQPLERLFEEYLG